MTYDLDIWHAGSSPDIVWVRFEGHDHIVMMLRDYRSAVNLISGVMDYGKVVSVGLNEDSIMSCSISSHFKRDSA